MFLSINDGRLPEASTDNSAGLDVFINETVEIWAGFQEVVKLGIKLDLEEVKKLEIAHNHFLDLRVRSSMRLRGLSSLGDGVIDLDYPEEFKMVIHNHNRDGRVQFRKGDKIGQLILIQHNERATYKYRQTTEQRAGGFGSTDKTMTGEEFSEMFKGK